MNLSNPDPLLKSSSTTWVWTAAGLRCGWSAPKPTRMLGCFQVTQKSDSTLSPLVNVYITTEKVTISMAIFNSTQTVQLPEGKHPFSYGFPVVFPWFSNDFPTQIYVFVITRGYFSCPAGLVVLGYTSAVTIHNTFHGAGVSPSHNEKARESHGKWRFILQETHRTMERSTMLLMAKPTSLW